MASGRTPQVWKWPALTRVKLPAGGLPEELSPQQATVASVRTPQV